VISFIYIITCFIPVSDARNGKKPIEIIEDAIKKMNEHFRCSGGWVPRTREKFFVEFIEDGG